MSEVTVNYLNKNNKEFKILPMSLKRSWMDDSYQKFAYKCVPLNIANQYGWMAINPKEFTVSWDGRQGLDAILVEGDGASYVSSHFGEGVVTINVDFIIQTPVGYSLYISGIANEMYDGIQPLDAIVETDWLPFTFTYNFKFTRPCTIKFHKEEPLFSFFPIKRGDAESLTIKSAWIEDNQQLYDDYTEYSESRTNYLENNTGKFQKFYRDGSGPNKKYKIDNHTKRLFFDTIE
jgi:hypothetical protein